MINRRGLITGLISLAAAPAIVRAQSLMPVKVIKKPLSDDELIKLWIQMLERMSSEMQSMVGITIMYGSSVTRISHDPNTSDGIVFTPVHNFLKLD